MTREQFVKVKFKAYQRINYVGGASKKTVECLLVAVHFDRELMTLDKVTYMDEEFISHIKDCYIPLKTNNE
jgi:transcriptional antiterminator Rof (Rho-off)